MKTKDRKTGSPTKARVIANNGERAVLELVDGFCLTLRRGFSRGYEMMFSEEFLQVLRVGRLIEATILDEDKFALARASDLKPLDAINNGVR